MNLESCDFSHESVQLQSVQNAVGQISRIEESINSLDQMPDRFRAYGKEPWYSRGLRVMPVDNYIVFYIPNHDTKVVNVVRVMYGGRNIDTQLSRFTKIINK